MHGTTDTHTHMLAHIGASLFVNGRDNVYIQLVES